MVDFRPFRGIRYAPQIAGRLDRLICPPYDVISEMEEQRLLEQSPYNMVALELIEPAFGIDPTKYRNAAIKYQEWLESGVLLQDQVPAYYFLRQRFRLNGTSFERYSLGGALRLQELGKGVFPHEHTGAAAKADRLSLLEATEANFSAVMALFRDANHLVKAEREKIVLEQPTSEFIAPDGQEYALWIVTEARAVWSIHSALESQPVYIADGHHRYETAITYLNNLPKQYRRSSRSAEFILMMLIDFDDPGLMIMPYHRLTRPLPLNLLEQLKKRIEEVFEVHPLGSRFNLHELLGNRVDKEREQDLTLSMVSARMTEAYRLSLNREKRLNVSFDLIEHSDLREVGAWVLQEEVFRPVLGDKFEDYVSYIHSDEEVLGIVKNGESQIAFLLEGITAELFERVVGNGLRLPRKSTFFYPKLPSGIVIKSLQGEL